MVSNLEDFVGRNSVADECADILSSFNRISNGPLTQLILNEGGIFYPKLVLRSVHPQN